MQVILVTIDCGRYDTLMDQARAPRIVGAVAPRARIYHRHFANANITLPSVTSILTSDYPRSTGIFSNLPEGRSLTHSFLDGIPGLQKHFLSNACFLRASAYKRLIGQWFDSYEIFELSEDATRRMTDAACDLLGRAGDTFLWVHYFNAHEPYGYTPDPTREDTFPEDVRFMRIRPNREIFTGASFDHLVGHYRYQIGFIDGQVARIFHFRKPESVFILTADHGEALGENDIFFAHAGLFPPTARIPLLICRPEDDRPDHIGRLTSNLDLGPTIRSIFGAPPLPSMRGMDILGEVPTGREVFIQAAGNTANALVCGGYMFIQAVDPYDPEHVDRCHETHLIDLSSEKDLLASGTPLDGPKQQLLRHMEARLDQWLEEPEVPPSRGEPDADTELQERLRYLGYM